MVTLCNSGSIVRFCFLLNDLSLIHILKSCSRYPALYGPICCIFKYISGVMVQSKDKAAIYHNAKLVQALDCRLVILV